MRKAWMQSQRRNNLPPQVNRRATKEQEPTSAVVEEHRYEEMASGMIMDIVVEDSQQPGKTRVKFLAISGGTGPELTMEKSLVVSLRDKLNEYLNKAA